MSEGNSILLSRKQKMILTKGKDKWGVVKILLIFSRVSDFWKRYLKEEHVRFIKWWDPGTALQDQVVMDL
jgi:hypothetical protein